MTSSYVRCPTCGEYGWRDSHRCKPVWEVCFPDFSATWREARGRDAEEAASKAAEEYDSGGDYDIIRSGEARADVRKPGETTAVRVEVSAEAVPTYRAREVRT